MFSFFKKVLLIVFIFIVVSFQSVGIARSDECPPEKDIITLIKLWGNKYYRKKGNDSMMYGDVRILQIGTNPQYCPVKASVEVLTRNYFTKEWYPVYTSALTMVFKIYKNDFGEWVITKLK